MVSYIGGHNASIDKRTITKNLKRSAALGRLGIKLVGGSGEEARASTSLRSTNPRP